MSIYSNPASSNEAETAAYVAALLELLGDSDPLAILAQTPAAVQRFLDVVPAPIVTTPEVVAPTSLVKRSRIWIWCWSRS